MQRLRLWGRFRYQRIARDGRVLVEGSFDNGVTDPALNDLFDSYCRNQAQPSAWYVGLIDFASFSALAAADTMASHAGWIENTDYSEGTRPQWTPPAASGQKLENTLEMITTMTAAVTIHGLFIASDNTKGGTTGILWASGLFGVSQTMAIGESLKLFYDLTGREG